MKFFLVIGKNSLYTFEKSGQGLAPRNIEGSKSYPLNVGNVSEDVKSYMECLANEANLGTIAKLEFDVLLSADESCNVPVLDAIDAHIKEKHQLLDTIAYVMRKLARDKKIFIEKYGINYEGNSYKYVDGKVVCGDFDLLAYTVHSNELVGFLE